MQEKDPFPLHWSPHSLLLLGLSQLQKERKEADQAKDTELLMDMSHEGLAREQVACRLEFGPPQVSVRSKSTFGGKNATGKKRKPRSERISEGEFEKVQI